MDTPIADLIEECIRAGKPLPARTLVPERTIQLPNGNVVTGSLDAGGIDVTHPSD